MYLALKFLHVLSAVVFIGNIAMGFFWKHRADRTVHPLTIAAALQSLKASDLWFTTPAVVLLTASGIVLAVLARQPIIGTLWIAAGIVLLTLSGLIFLVAVAPLQRRLEQLVTTALANNDFDLAAYRHMSVRWLGFGLTSLISALLALAIMVVRPTNFS